ncbi:glycosyltransferase family 9 protein [Acidaminococcus sp. NSJ-142]|jgi:heptosyltransferase-2|uniref:glycosyltransferase family 9 protein n=1 Tax=Acidaminococcus TaxID=904 RepID=UPI000CF883E7|nr:MULTISPECIES: glycosyltransferase family 9 protein [Acidaminococcus]MCD2435150.1 glycosyltransferase family 9 protein [Acidaminococcus hominis]MCH4096285.1 glycosyltransferase family 9 protein [Acidaminococcus provencensis]
MTYHKIFLDGIMHMGDMLMTASVLPVLRKHCPHAQIVYLAKKELAFVAEMLEGVDRVIPYGYQSGGGYRDVYRLGKKLGREGFDLGISLDPRERVTLMKWIARMPERLSLERGLGWELGWEKLFYTQDLPLPAGWNFQDHSMAVNFQQMLRLFFQDPDTQYACAHFKPFSQEVEDWCRALLTQQPGSKRVALCIQSSSPSKDWPAKKFSQICNWLIDKYQAVVYITGVSSHEAKAKTILKGISRQEQVVDLVGKSSFPQLAGLLSKMDLLLSLDTGTAHVGGVAGCPVITLFTHNSPVIYQAPGLHSLGVSGHLPCSGKYVCVGPNHCSKTDCVDAITLPMVQQAIESVFEKS